jgi:hypothetical protein
MLEEESNKPAGALGMIMPGAMAAANDHNNLELWKQGKDPNYVPKLVHPKPVEFSIPEVDRNADRSGVNGIIKDELQLEKPPVTPDYQIEGRRGDESVTPMLAMYLRKVAEQKKLMEQETPEEPKENPVEPEEPPVEPEETPEEPEETQKDELVPDTMPGIWKLLGMKANSLYDFGTRTLSPARKIPTLEASIKAYRRNMLLTVARALVLREYGTAFTAEQVRKSAIASWKNNGRMSKFSDVLHANRREGVEKRIDEILEEISTYMNGKVESKAKYLGKYKGEKWTIKSFVLMCKVTAQIDLKKTGWRSTKKH